MSPFLMVVLPGQIKDFAHDAEEFMYKMQGSIKIVYGGAIYTVRMGDSVYLDSGNVHHFINEGTESAMLLPVNHVFRRY